MFDDNRLFFETDLLELTSRQKQVVEILSTKKSQKYALADWYRGAIYVAKSEHNPDRFSQAAQSLRELLEKFPRVFVESEIQGSRPNFKEMRNNLYSQLRSEKDRYGGEWKGKKIKAKLNKTLLGIEKYFEMNQMPTRKETIQSSMCKVDPMHDALDQKILSEKSQRFSEVWSFFEELAHHKPHTNEESFWQYLSLLDGMIIDLLAPITAQDQRTIREILDKPQPDHTDIEKLLELIKRRGANYAYFFKTVDRPIWVKPLFDNGFFKKTPNAKVVGKNRIVAPRWWPIQYLQRISKEKPEQVVDIILGLEQTDNPRTLREFFSIACDLEDTALSLRLKPMIKQFLKSPYNWSEEELIVNILKKWGSDQGPSRNAAFEIIQYVIAFQPYSEKDEEGSLDEENPGGGDILMEPAPRFGQREYQKILEEGVRPLAEQEPYQVARLLVPAVANMIQLRVDQEDLKSGSGQDYSEFWCRRLNRQGHNQNVRELLVQTLTYACEQVYEKAPESVDALDQTLGKQRWELFNRLRQHLYASYPNDQTLPWIREQILGHEEYSRWTYHYEFQLMIRKASEHFGPGLLREDERKGIFEAILRGPSEETLREREGERYSEELFQRYRRYFHRRQLRPFLVLLSGDLRHYFEELEGEAQAEPLTDESYSLRGEVTTGTISYRSPKPAEDLEHLTDEELLTYLNDWEEEHQDEEDWLVEVNILALAEVFHSLLKEKIVPVSKRLAFWLKKRDRIARPVYVTAMIKAMTELIKEKKVDNLDKWTEFCAWVLSHPDTAHVEGQPEPKDKSRDYPDWGGSRRAVVEFIDACVSGGTDAPITARNSLAALLGQVCNQPDWRLDHGSPGALNRNGPIHEAINNTRSRALGSLVHFGFWVRRQLPDDQLPEVTEILSKRLAKEAETPLTRPEQALLGMYFGNLCALNRDWAAQERERIFPQAEEALWRDAFSSYILNNRPDKLTFEILRGELEYALENLKILVAESPEEEPIDRLGQHLFTYFLWDVYPLTGEGSLLERFYEKTADDRKRWVELFKKVGISLNNSGKDLATELTERVIAYFEWRFEAAEPLELQEFSSWLEAQCLDPEWRLQSFSKILDMKQEKNSETEMDRYMQVHVLRELLPGYEALVVECFVKITEAMDQDSQMYVPTDEVMPILKAGLASEDTRIHEKAERARENLLRLGRFEFLDVE